MNAGTCSLSPFDLHNLDVTVYRADECAMGGLMLSCFIWLPPIQVIDDTKGHTLVSASSLQPSLKETVEEGKTSTKVADIWLAPDARGLGARWAAGSTPDQLVTCMHTFPPSLLQAAAEAVGKKIAELCSSKNITKVAFDRGGFLYHGRIEVRTMLHDRRKIELPSQLRYEDLHSTFKHVYALCTCQSA